MPVGLHFGKGFKDLTTFNALGLAEPILRAVTLAGYETPTPIQQQVIPELIAGHDVLGIAQTGTGKTASFVLPVLQGLAMRAADDIVPPRTCRALILSPTRELTNQIADNIRTYSKFLRPSVAVVVGGARPGPQIKRLTPGCDIVVATPGRLLDHIGSGVVRLDKTTTVVLDEADQMMDLGFLPAIRQILGKLPNKRQTVLLSATMPKQIRALARDFLTGPKEISVAPQSRPIERITQKIFHMERGMKRRFLVDLLQNADRAVVFVRTKYGADNIQRFLEKSGLSSAAIHGNKSQGQRERALQMFKNGRIGILVATDIAARGIDVDGISHVINYDLPNIAESYVHRIGRTARAGASGTAYSLVDGSERKYLRAIERLIGMTLDAQSVPTTPQPPISADPSVENRKPDKPRHKPKAKRNRSSKVNKHHRPKARKATTGNRRPEPVRSAASGHRGINTV